MCVSADYPLLAAGTDNYIAEFSSETHRKIGIVTPAEWKCRAIEIFRDKNNMGCGYGLASDDGFVQINYVCMLLFIYCLSIIE